MDETTIQQKSLTTNKILQYLILGLTIITLPLFFLVIFDVVSTAVFISFIVSIALTVAVLIFYIIKDIIRILKARKNKNDS